VKENCAEQSGHHETNDDSERQFTGGPKIKPWKHGPEPPV